MIRVKFNYKLNKIHFTLVSNSINVIMIVESHNKAENVLLCNTYDTKINVFYVNFVNRKYIISDERLLFRKMKDY